MGLAIHQRHPSARHRFRGSLLRGASYEGLPLEGIVSGIENLSSFLSRGLATSANAGVDPLLARPLPARLFTPAMPVHIPSFPGDPLLRSVADAASSASAGVAAAWAAALEGSSPLGSLLSHVDPAAQPLLLAPVAALAAGLALAAWDDAGAGSGAEGAELPVFRGAGGMGAYDEAGAAAYYAKRPLVVLRRLATLAALTGGFNARLLGNYIATPKGPDGNKVR